MSPYNIRQAFLIMQKVGLTSWDRFLVKSNLSLISTFSRIAFSHDSTYAEIFQTGFDLRQFNWYLNDLSFFQISYRGAGPSLELRYAYYPNPFISDYDSLGPELIADELKLEIFLDDARSEISTPPVRYEYDQEQFVPFSHPTSHWHIGHKTTGRVACKHVLSPEAFCMCIIKWFYGNEWSSHQDSENRELCLETTWRTHCARLDELSTACMTDDERACLHIGF